MTLYNEQNQNPKLTSNNPPERKRSITKIVLIFLAILISLIILCLAFLPTIISSKWGNEKLVAIANQQIPGTLSVEKISVSWLGPQEVHGILLKDPQGASILSLKQGSSQSSLFRLLLKDLSLAGLTLESFNGTLATDAQGNTNIEKALNKKCCQSKLSETEKPIAIMFKNVNALVNLDTSNNKHLSLHLAGETLQNTQSGNFVIEAQLKGIALKQLLDMDQQTLDQLRASGQAEFKVNAEIVNFPVILLDQFIALKHPELGGILQETLGQQFNLTLNQTTVANGLEFTLNAKSAQMAATVNATINNTISLKKPLSITLKITPQLISKLAAAARTPIPWQLKAPTTAELTIDSFQYPLHLLGDKSFAELDLTPLALIGTLKLQPTSFAGGNEVNINIQQLIALIQFDAEKPAGTFSIKGDAKHNGHPFTINLNSSIVKPKKLADLTKNFFNTLSAQGEVKGLPISLIDSQLGLNNQLTEAIGNSADINISIDSEKNKPMATLQIKSDFLDIPALTFALGKDIVLNKAAIAKLHISPNLIEKIALGNIPKGQLREMTSAIIKLNKLSFPWDNSQKSSSFLDGVVLETDIAFSSILLKQVPSIGNVALNDLNLNINGKSLSRAACLVTCTLSQTGEGRLHDLLGEETKISASTNLHLMPNQAANIESIDVKVLSDLAQMNMTGTIQNNTFILTSPAEVRYKLTSPALRTLGIVSMDNFNIRHATPLEFRIFKSIIPLNANALSNLKLAGEIKIRDLSLIHRQDQSIPEAILDTLDLHWNLDTPSHIVRFNFDGTTHLGQQQDQGSFSGNAAIDNWTHQDKAFDFSQAIVHFKAKAYKLPAAFIGGLVTKTDLTPLLGNSFETNISADINLGSKATGTLAVDVHSELLDGTANFKINNGIFLNDPNRPAQLNLTLTPRGYSALRQQFSSGASDFVLSEPAHMILQLRSLNIPSQTNASKGISFWKSAIDADMTIDQLVGMDKKSQSKITLNVINGRIFSKDISQHTTFEMYAEGKTNTNLQTSLNITGSLENGFSDLGSINHKDLSLNLDANLINLPVPLLCQFACLDYKMGPKLNAVIGSNLDAKIRTQLQQMNGQIYVELKGEHGHTILDGQISYGILTLNNNFYAELTVTPQLGTHVLQDLIPFLSGILGSDQPLKLAIAKEGFSLPLGQFAIENVSIGNASLELGKVRFSNEGQIAKVLSLLTTASASEIMVWLTPTYFSLNKGLFALQRVDMLISDRYPIAAWGKVNIPADNVNMVIALSGAAIGRAFSVPGIKKGFLLQLPLRGTMKNTSIDKSKAVARLSALVAQSQGGPQGLILGTVLDVATGSFTEDAPPAPTTNPLPWNEMMEDKSNSSGSTTPVEEINKIIPIEEIGKGAGSLFKKIFKNK